MDLPGNSDKSKIAGPPPMPRIVNDTTTKVRPSLFQTLIAKNFDELKDYILFDLVVPKLKDTIMETMSMMFYGDARPRNGYSSGGTRVYRVGSGPYDYSGVSTQRAQAPIRSRRSVTVIQKPISEEEALDVRDNLLWSIERYGKAQLSQYYQMVGIETTSTDSNWGWRNLDSIPVIPVGNGQFMLQLPKPEPLT